MRWGCSPIAPPFPLPMPHHKLLTKLQKLGISGNLLRWFQAYLTNRSHCVCIENLISFLSCLVFHKGAYWVLYCLPYTLMISLNTSNTIALMFADDTKCIKPIHDINDIVLLQEDVYHAMQWSSSCDLAFNVSKFIHMNCWSNSLSSSYCINSHNIMLTNQCKDQGIIFTSNLNSISHIEMIISWAYKILGLLRRTFHTSCINTKRQLYLSLVRSQLIFCSELWRPNLIKDISCLEQVQHRATKYILNDFSSDFKTCLLKLNLLPLMYIII